MTRRAPRFTIERRPLPPRAPAQPGLSPEPVRESNIPATPIAREVYYALRTAPIRFPHDWTRPA